MDRDTNAEVRAGAVRRVLPRSFLRQLIYDELADYRRHGGRMTVEDALPAVQDRLREQYEGSPFLTVLLELAAVLLPYLLDLFTEN